LQFRDRLIVHLFLLGGFAVTEGLPVCGMLLKRTGMCRSLKSPPKSMSTLRRPSAQGGGQVQLNITALDKTHGFKINLYPDGSDTKGDPGVIFGSKEGFKMENGTLGDAICGAYTGNLLVPLLQPLRARPRRAKGPAYSRTVISINVS
jgi:hypothetical protein